ncbi:transposase domain-containing protein [Streptomyces sp. NPDC048496]|uniref:transposase domain-containing protein n=1 Tax=Streptomyces sp. NPDC048496 TaxID=3365558 RepID=UPI003715F13A
MSPQRDLWRARCGESRTAGSGSGLGKRAGRTTGTAPQADFHLALFEGCSYRGVWGKLTARLEGLPLVRPAVSSLSRARRRIGAAPLRRLFEILAGPVAHLGQAGSSC